MAEQFRHRLRQARKEAGLTQHALAAKAGVSIQAVSAWEQGERMPTGLNLVQLAITLSVRVEWLAGIDGETVANGTHGR